jgi:hypothetical protein
MAVDGTTQTWQDAVAADVAGFEEPYNGVFDLPPDVAAAEGELPASFDPSLGSVNEDGEQPEQHDGDILDEDDVNESYAGAEDSDGDDAEDSDNDASDVDNTPAQAPTYSSAAPSRERDEDSSGGSILSSIFGGSGSSDSSSSDSGSSD